MLFLFCPQTLHVFCRYISRFSSCFFPSLSYYPTSTRPRITFSFDSPLRFLPHHFLPLASSSASKSDSPSSSACSFSAPSSSSAFVSTSPASPFHRCLTPLSLPLQYVAGSSPSFSSLPLSAPGYLRFLLIALPPSSYLIHCWFLLFIIVPSILLIVGRPRSLLCIPLLPSSLHSLPLFSFPQLILLNIIFSSSSCFPSLAPPHSLYASLLSSSASNEKPLIPSSPLLLRSFFPSPPHPPPFPPPPPPPCSTSSSCYSGRRDDTAPLQFPPQNQVLCL